MYQILAVSTSSITSRAFSDKNIDDEFILRNYVVTFNISVDVTFGRIHVFCCSWSQWDKKQTERVPKFLNSIFFINKWHPKIFNWEEITRSRQTPRPHVCIRLTEPQLSQEILARDFFKIYFVVPYFPDTGSRPSSPDPRGSGSRVPGVRVSRDDNATPRAPCRAWECEPRSGVTRGNKM